MAGEPLAGQRRPAHDVEVDLPRDGVRLSPASHVGENLAAVEPARWRDVVLGLWHPRLWRAGAVADAIRADGNDEGVDPISPGLLDDGDQP